MKWILIALGAIVVLVALVGIVGALLPRGHVASRRARFAQSPEALWAAISSFESLPAWRADLKRIERLPDRDGHPVWREEGKFGKLTYEIVEVVPPKRLVTRIADPDLPFGGSWTWEIEPAGAGGATVRITENGEIKTPIFRFMARFVFGYTSTMEQVLKGLGRKFGETPAFDRSP